MGASPKGTVKLSDGREVAVDVSTMTVRQWRNLWSPSATDEETDRIVATCTDLKPDALLDLLRDDYRRIVREIVELSNRPLDDPN